MSTPTAPSITGRWTPPPAVVARGVELQGQIPHRFGSVVQPGDQGQRPIAPATQAFKRWITEHFPGMFSSIGAARSPSSRWHTAGGTRDLHEEGRALDLMTGDQATLERFANALVWHAQDIGLQYVLTRRLEWSASRLGTAWEIYTGPSPHVDHVHVELSPSVAGDPARVVAALDRALASGWWAPDSAPSSAPSAGTAAAIAAGAVAIGAAAVALGSRA